MSVVSVLSGLATAAGKGYQGYGVDQELGVKNALAQQNAERQAERDRVLNLLTKRQIDRPQLGDPDYAKLSGEVKGAETAAETPALVSRAQALSPVAVSQHEGMRKVDVANPLPTPASGTVLPGADGKPPQLVVTGGNNAAHPLGSTIAVPDVNKAPTGGVGARGFGAGGIFGGASGLGSIKEMHAALPQLQKFEVGLLSEAPGSPSLRLFDTYRLNILRAANHASGGHGAIAAAVSNAAQTGAAEEMARINPQLAVYARNVAQWIVADLNLTRSASDERGRMDQIASSVLSLPLSDMPIGERIRYVHQIGEGRRARLEGLDKVVPAAESMLAGIAKQNGGSPKVAPAVPSSGGKRLTPEQYQRARQHYSDEEIRAQGYDIP